jgi:uncharacterized UBP type Zn finger protein
MISRKRVLIAKSFSFSDSITFDLIAVVVHLGKRADSGHYICIRKNKQDDSWWVIDNHVASKQKDDTILCDVEVERGVSILLYQKRSAR